MLRKRDEEEESKEEIFASTFINEKESIQCLIMSYKECPMLRGQWKSYNANT